MVLSLLWSGAAAAAPAAAGWALESAEGAAPGRVKEGAVGRRGSPARRHDPSVVRAAAAGRCGAGGGFVCVRRVLGVQEEAPHPGQLLLRTRGSKRSLAPAPATGRRAGVGRAFSWPRPLLLSRGSPLPAG